VLNSQAPRYGARRLKQTLQAKGLDPALVAATLQQARGSEFERALDIWRRRFGTAAASAAERARQMRFLAGRGFEGDVIRRVMRAPENDDAL
jgi:regulatory protein